MSFLDRARRKLKSKALQLSGAAIQGLVQVNIHNASDLETRYEGVRTRVLVETSSVAPIQPKHLPEDALAIIQPFHVGCESVFLEIVNPDFSLRNHLLLDGEMNAWCSDLLPHEDLLSSRKYAPKHLLQLAGTVAYLSNTWIDNYYHWMQLTLPLLRLYEKFDSGFQADYYYLGESTLTGVQTETLQELGIGADKIVREPCRADRIVSAIYWHQPQHGGVRYRDNRGHEFVRSLYYPTAKDDSCPRRIYIERGDSRTRRIVNEAELAEFLAQFGFASLRMSGKAVGEQAKLFGNAEIIISAHGAALTNLLFAAEGSMLVEIFPPGYEEASYFAASTYSKLAYSYLLAEEAPGGNMVVNLKKLARLLEMNGV